MALFGLIIVKVHTIHLKKSYVIFWISKIRFMTLIEIVLMWMSHENVHSFYFLHKTISRMRITRLETKHASVLVATARCQFSGVGIGPPMNKLEQVSSDHHQMSLAGVGPQVWCQGG